MATGAAATHLPAPLHVVDLAILTAGYALVAPAASRRGPASAWRCAVSSPIAAPRRSSIGRWRPRWPSRSPPSSATSRADHVSVYEGRKPKIVPTSDAIGRTARPRGTRHPPRADRNRDGRTADPSLRPVVVRRPPGHGAQTGADFGRKPRDSTADRSGDECPLTPGAIGITPSTTRSRSVRPSPHVDGRPAGRHPRAHVLRVARRSNSKKPSAFRRGTAMIVGKEASRARA